MIHLNLLIKERAIRVLLNIWKILLKTLLRYLNYCMITVVHFDKSILHIPHSIIFTNMAKSTVKLTALSKRCDTQTVRNLFINRYTYPLSKTLTSVEQMAVFQHKNCHLFDRCCEVLLFGVDWVLGTLHYPILMFNSILCSGDAHQCGSIYTR
jgi:hypothetical protein